MQKLSEYGVQIRAISLDLTVGLLIVNTGFQASVLRKA